METMSKLPQQGEPTNLDALRKETGTETEGVGRRNGKGRNRRGKNKSPDESKRLESLKKDVEARQNNQTSSESESEDKTIKSENLLKRTISTSESDEDKMVKKNKKIYEPYVDGRQIMTNDADTDEIEMADQDEVATEEINENEKSNDQQDQNTDHSPETLDELHAKSDDVRNGKHGSITGENDDEQNKIVFIKGTQNDITKVNAMRIKQRVEEIAGTIEEIRRSKDSLKVLCKTVADKVKLMKVKTLAGHEVNLTEPYKMVRQSTIHTRINNRGIIFGVGRDVSDEEMTETIGI